MKIQTAIQRLRPGSSWSVPNGSVLAADIIWHDDTAPISQDELDALLSEPEPDPPIMTPEEKLAAAGLTIDELKNLLGLK